MQTKKPFSIPPCPTLSTMAHWEMPMPPKALAVVYNTTKMEVIYITVGSARTDKTPSIAIPLECGGGDFSIYLGFISEDGSKVANSSYVTSTTKP